MNSKSSANSWCRFLNWTGTFGLVSILGCVVSASAADNSSGWDYQAIKSAYDSRLHLELKAPKVSQLSIGTWILIARRSKSDSPKVSPYPDGADPEGLKNADGSLPTLSFFATSYPQCLNPYGIKISSWGQKDRAVTNTLGCSGMYDVVLNKNSGSGKPLAFSENDFPFVPPMDTVCQFSPKGTENGSRDRLVCLVSQAGRIASDQFVGGLVFERKGE